MSDTKVEFAWKITTATLSVTLSTPFPWVALGVAGIVGIVAIVAIVENRNTANASSK